MDYIGSEIGRCERFGFGDNSGNFCNGFDLRFNVLDILALNEGRSLDHMGEFGDEVAGWTIGDFLEGKDLDFGSVFETGEEL